MKIEIALKALMIGSVLVGTLFAPAKSEAASTHCVCSSKPGDYSGELQTQISYFATSATQPVPALNVIAEFPRDNMSGESCNDHLRALVQAGMCPQTSTFIKKSCFDISDNYKIRDKYKQAGHCR